MTEAGLAVRSEVMDVVPTIDESQMAANYLGSLSVSDVLGNPSDADDRLHFDTAHVFDASPPDGDGQVTELRFGGEPLHAERFLYLLEAIAPTPSPLRDEGLIAEDILDDWIIFEEGDNPNLEDLAEAHSKLKGWDQLGREYPDIKAALDPVRNFRLSPQMMPGNEKIIRSDKSMQGWGNADQLADHQPLISGAEFVELLTDIYGTEETRSRIIEAMRHIAPSKEEGADIDPDRLEDNELFQLFLDLDMETRNRLVSVKDIQGTYHPNGDSSWTRNEQTEKFTELYLERHCVTFEDEEGRLMYTHGVRPDFDVEQAYADRKRTYHGDDRPRVNANDLGTGYEYETMEIDTVIGKQTAIIPGSVKFQELGLVPAVRWSVGPDGKRRQQSLPEHRPLTGYKHNVLSSVAGHMVLAYLQPERRSHWKKEAGLAGLEATQDMGPAQVPLIALQQSARLLNNDLMREAETLRQS